jgi:tripartite-type tricarboxylate transporter receptor subunit TctC
MKSWPATIPVMMLAWGLADAAFAQGTAQNYPNKPIRWVVPFAPGGPSDLLVRTIGQKLTAAWGQPVVADNRSGANGAVGSELVAKSAPDGYTLLIGSNGTHGINASLYAKLPYDTINDFAPITRVGQVPFVLVAHPSLPARTVGELIRLARLKPGQISYASGGSPSHLAGELFKSMARVDLLHVPYKGASLAITDVIGGQVSLTFGGIALAAQQINAGRLRALAVTGMRRSPVMPEVPTVAESGVPGYEVSTWYGVFAPGATPRVIVERINAEIVKVMELPDVRERLLGQAFEPLADTPQQFAALVRAEIVKWAKVVKESGARAD